MIGSRWITRSLLGSKNQLLLMGFFSGFLFHFLLSSNNQVNLIESDTVDGRITIDSHYHQEQQEYDQVTSLKKDRILCWIMTAPKTHSRAHLIKETWGRRCDQLVFTSSAHDSSVPTVAVKVEEDVYDNLWGKFKSAIKYIYDHHLDDADWFYKSDDDAYMIIENLRLMLSKFNSSLPLHMGFKFKDAEIPEGFLSGGPGYILTREAIRRFVEQFYVHELELIKKNQTENAAELLLCQPGVVGLDDYELGSCLVKLNVSIPDSRDPKGKERFLPFSMEDEICGHVKYPYPTPFYLRNWAYYPLKEDMDCCSSYPVGFHYVKDYQLKVYEYLIYHLKVYNPLMPVVW